jgi:hypothetical protein
MKKRQVPKYVANVRALVSASLLACGALTASSAHAALTFVYNFQGGFVGNAAAQQAVVTAGQLFSNMFATHFSNTATVEFNVVGGTDGVASASSFLNVGPGFGTGEGVRNKVVNGVDLFAGADGVINVNLGLNFQFNPNAPVDFAGGQLDFFSVFDHEVTHSLGFFSAGTTTGDQALSKFDQFLTTNGGVSLYDPVTGARNLAAFADAMAGTAVFNGPGTVASYGSPASIQGVGGDLSHLGTVAFSAPVGGSPNDNALMLCCGGLNVTGQGRDYNLAEIGILRDLGYTAVAVPEPGTYALMLSGLALLAFATKRTKR